MVVLKTQAKFIYFSAGKLRSGCVNGCIIRLLGNLQSTPTGKVGLRRVLYLPLSPRLVMQKKKLRRLDWMQAVNHVTKTWDKMP